jgi:hypothetical protein
MTSASKRVRRIPMNPGDWSPANPGEACETGLYCTIDGHCQEGVCQGVPRDCGADQCHNAWCIEVDEECAVAAAYPSALIHVGEGVYSGALEVNQVGLTIVGAGQELVTVSVGADETAIRVTASDVTITDLSTTGGVVGILFAGTPQLPLAGGRVARVTVKNMASTSGIQVDSAGISAHYVDDFSLSQFGIALMEGNNDLMGGAYGVDLVYADDAVIAGGTIDSIIGGHADSIWETPGGRGGPGYGVKIASSKGVLLRGLTVNQVTGGEGSFVHSQIGQYAGVGGLAAAVHLAGSSGTTIDALEAASLTGGAGGNGFSYTPGVAQRAYGIYLSADSLDTTVDVNCRYEGEPILYFNGLLDATIAGFVVVKDVFPTNLGKLVVVNSTNVLIADNKVANLVGETGEQTTATGQIGKPGGDVAGILLHNCNGCRVIANVAHDIAGGKGGNGALCGDGGVGAGIWVRASEDVELAGNHTWSIQGGDDGDPHTHGAGGVGYGYLLESSSQLAFHNNLAYGIDSGTGRVACDYPAACVGIDDCEPMLLSHLTCWNIGPQNCGGGDGVRLLGNQDESVHVVNSILSQVNGYCLSTEAPAGGPLGSAYCLLDGCQDGLATGNAASSGSNLLFHNAAGGSLRLQPGSPGIDAGKASSDCSLEPFPNGCRVNIGAFGNTLDATANDGADHCDVCPGQ